MWKISFGNVDQRGFANFCSSSQFIVDALSSHRDAIFRLYVRFHNWDWQDFSKGFSLRIKKEKQCRNSASPFVLLGLHHSYSSAKHQRDPAPQERLFQQASRDSLQEGDGREIPSTMETCRSFTSNEARGAWNRSGETLCSKRKHRRWAGLQQTQLSNGILQLLPELPGAPRGQRQLWSPQPSLGTRAPRTFPTTSSQCSVVSTQL